MIYPTNANPSLSKRYVDNGENLCNNIFATGLSSFKGVRYIKKRFESIDSFRGFIIINMVLFHLLYDINSVFGENYSWHRDPLVDLWQRFIACSFIIISGFVWTYGKKRALRRGILLNIIGLVITAVTVIFIPSEAIYFGVMNFFGCAVILMIPAEKLLRHVTPIIGATLSLVLFILFEDLTYGVIKIGSHVIATLPDMMYSLDLLIPFGLPPRSFVSADYFPIFPWIFVYFLGYFLYRLVAETAFFEKIGHINIPILSRIGRLALPIYVVHQPLCYLICMLLF